GPPRRRSGPGRAGKPLPDHIHILFEDSGLLALDKPEGMPVRLKGRGVSLADIASDYLSMARPDARAIVLHEIDKEASGVVVFAKHPRAASLMKPVLNALRGDRAYLALVEGAPSAPEGMIQSHLRVSARGVPESVPPGAGPSTSNQRPAVTQFRVAKSGAEFSLLRVRAETDFACQVRAHLSERGHPIVGDKAYRSTFRDAPRVFLHLEELAFRHPASGQTLRVRAPAPAEFWTALGQTPPPTARPAAPKTSPVTNAEGAPAGEAGWEHVAPWYANYVATGRSDHHEQTVMPGALRLLALPEQARLLDVGCGEGVFERYLAKHAPGVTTTGVDASAELIERARAHPLERAAFEVADARALDQLNLEPAAFDAGVSILALMNIDPVEDVFNALAPLLRPGAPFVGVILHPAFRSPGLSHWGWTRAPGEDRRLQFRRVDAYLSDAAKEIVMNPGAAAAGAPPITTTTYHRSLSHYVSALRGAGFVIEAIEEWASARTSQPGPNAEEENRAREEFPMFLAFRAIRRAPEETAG
ncbi:MAG: pseudouridine synthase, partial [Phycisphaerales bacterium JB059]